MNSKILVFSDLHIACHKKSYDRLNDCLAALEWVFKTAQDKNIQNIVFAGDLFHDRQKIDVLVYQLAFDIISKYCSGHNSTNLYLLLGNHDLWYHDRWDVSSTKALSALPGVHVINKPSSIEIAGSVIDFLPFTMHPLEHLQDLRHRKGNGHKTLVAHLAVHGAQLNTLHNTRSDVVIEHDGEMVFVDVASFAHWDQTFLGHYHGEQKLNSQVEYVGSTLQLNFGEAFQHKHIIVYDPATGDKEYIRNTFSPQHLIVPAKDADKFPLKGNFIRLEVDTEDLATSGIIELRKELQKECPACLELLPVQKKVKEQDVKDAKAILYKEDEMLDQWVKQQIDLGTLDREKLLGIGKKICQIKSESSSV